MQRRQAGQHRLTRNPALRDRDAGVDDRVARTDQREGEQPRRWYRAPRYKAEASSPGCRLAQRGQQRPEPRDGQFLPHVRALALTGSDRTGRSAAHDGDGPEPGRDRDASCWRRAELSDRQWRRARDQPSGRQHRRRRGCDAAGCRTGAGSRRPAARRGPSARMSAPCGAPRRSGGAACACRLASARRDGDGNRGDHGPCQRRLDRWLRADTRGSASTATVSEQAADYDPHGVPLFWPRPVGR